jgi:hypothetical protein
MKRTSKATWGANTLVAATDCMIIVATAMNGKSLVPRYLMIILRLIIDYWEYSCDIHAKLIQSSMILLQ